LQLFLEFYSAEYYKIRNGLTSPVAAIVMNYINFLPCDYQNLIPFSSPCGDRGI